MRVFKTGREPMLQLTLVLRIASLQKGREPCRELTYVSSAHNDIISLLSCIFLNVYLLINQSTLKVLLHM